MGEVVGEWEQGGGGAREVGSTDRDRQIDLQTAKRDLQIAKRDLQIAKRDLQIAKRGLQIEKETYK